MRSATKPGGYKGVIFVDSLACVGVVLFGSVVILVYMKSGIEKVTKSVQSIRRFRSLYLFILFAIAVFIFNIAYLDRFHINVDSARYLLSALVQSQAAIVAIVVTLTLIAVQLAASSYSPRVIDIFKNDPTMWDLLFSYGMSIFFGLFVLEMIQDEDPSQTIFWSFHNIYINISISLEWLIYLAYWFGLVAFAVLSVYMITIIDLLKPENIIKRLSEDISKENVLKFIESEEKQKEDRTKKIEDDPVQPIMDIIHSSIMKYDIATTRIGLKVATDRTIEIIDSDSQKEISKWLCDHLKRVNRLTISNTDEDSTVEVIDNLYNFEKLAAEKELEAAAGWAVQSLEDVGKIAAEKGFEDAASEAVWSLRAIGITAAKKELDGATWRVVQSLEDVGITAAEKDLEVTAFNVAVSLRDVGITAAEKELDGATKQAVRSLIYVGITAAEEELEDVAWRATRSLAELTISSEGIIKIAIQNYKSKLKKQDRDSFQKFMSPYEQQLKGLRTKNPGYPPRP